MNSEQNHTNTTRAYIRGFLLSLIFTLVPYYMVVNHMLSGTMLLGGILAFAVLQMLVQVLFFLHLGREKKPYWQTGFLVATVGEIFVVVVGSMWIISHLHANMTPVTALDESKKLIQDEGIYQIGGTKTGACEGVHANHKVTITNGQVSPFRTAAHLCDTLTFINEDDSIRDIAFGQHPSHEVYAGESELTVMKGHPKTITLSEPGTHSFHDHFHEQTTGSFTVK